MKWKYKVLGVLEFFVAFGALPAGIAMIIEPNGMGVGMGLEILEGTPFKNFLIPGLFLVIFHGLGSLIGGILSFMRHRLAAGVGLLLGVIMLIWIVVQVYFIGLTHFFQWLFFLIGSLEAGLAYLLLRKTK